ncbi:MAG: cell division protein FtsL [Thermoanaerobacterales bacterium]|nr:cell division protein FtsL [Bacillota bacterium]MDI6906483.1 cell division protein FtsL [Thermoanaerobacterales bacterium]
MAQEKPNYTYAEQPVAAPPPRERRRPNEDRRWCGAVTILLLVSLVLGVGVSFYSTQVVKVGYNLTTLKQEIARLDAENQNLEAALGRLDSLERVETVATTKLGMVAPSERNVMYVALNPPVDEPPKGEKAAEQVKPGNPGARVALNTTAGEREPDGLWQAFLRVVCQRGTAGAGNG